ELGPLGRQRALDLVGDLSSLHDRLVGPMGIVGEKLVDVAKRPERAGDLRTHTCTVLEILLDEWILLFGKHREAPSTWAGVSIEREDRLRAAAARLGVATVPKAFFEADLAGVTRALDGNGDLRDRMVLVFTDAATA